MNWGAGRLIKALSLNAGGPDFKGGGKRDATEVQHPSRSTSTGEKRKKNNKTL